MLLSLQELLAAMRRRKNYDDLMLELSGLTACRFLRKEQIERIRAASGLASAGETANERAWRRYFELTDPVIRQLAHVNRAIGRALIRSEPRVQAAHEALDGIRARATVTRQGKAPLSHARPAQGLCRRGRRAHQRRNRLHPLGARRAELGAAPGGGATPARRHGRP
jgi:hypothetical protein